MVVKKIVLGVALGLVAGVVPAVNLAAAAPSAGDNTPRVQVQQGTLRGTVDQGADAFLGIPYAQSPTGRLRFRAPQAPMSWNGVRDATVLPPACLQFQPTGVRPEQATSEDCLYLDVYRPVGAQHGDHLPVIFWMHGGAYTQGTGVIYGGQTMASLTHTIVVSINYRLGALGYLAVPQMGGNAGNWGTLDQIAALRWVRTNIAAFGGDPANITIDGQSAGSGSVCSMLASPLTSGLFSRAILESGPCNALTGKPIAEAYQQGRQYLAAAGCGTADDVMACLRAAWAPNLVAAEQQVVINAPVVGGNVSPTQPATAIANGKWHKVPILIGTVRWEGKLFETNGDLTAAQYEQQIRASYGANADAVLAHYPVSDYRKPFYALAAVLADSFMAVPPTRSPARSGGRCRPTSTSSTTRARRRCTASPSRASTCRTRTARSSPTCGTSPSAPDRSTQPKPSWRPG